MSWFLGRLIEAEVEGVKGPVFAYVKVAPMVPLEAEEHFARTWISLTMLLELRNRRDKLVVSSCPHLYSSWSTSGVASELEWMMRALENKIGACLFEDRRVTVVRGA